MVFFSVLFVIILAMFSLIFFKKAIAATIYIYLLYMSASYLLFLVSAGKNNAEGEIVASIILVFGVFHVLIHLAFIKRYFLFTERDGFFSEKKVDENE